LKFNVNTGSLCRLAVDGKEEKPVSNLKLLSRILRLKDIKITQFWFENCDKELHLVVKPYSRTYFPRIQIADFTDFSSLSGFPNEFTKHFGLMQ
jgi:AraC-like DNA-binding protein